MFFVLFNFLIFSNEEIHVKYHLENISSLTNVCYFYNDDLTKILSVNHDFFFLLEMTGHTYWKRKRMLEFPLINLDLKMMCFLLYCKIFNSISTILQSPSLRRHFCSEKEACMRHSFSSWGQFTNVILSLCIYKITEVAYGEGRGWGLKKC